MTTDEKLFQQEIPTSGSRLITDCSPVSPEQRAAHEEAIKSMKAAVRITLDVNGEDLMMDVKRANALTRIARDLFPHFGSYHGVIEALAKLGALKEGKVDQLDIEAVQRGFNYEMGIMILKAQVSDPVKIEPLSTATQNDPLASPSPQALTLIARNLSFLRKHCGLTWRALGLKSGVDEDGKSVKAHCNGSRVPNVPSLKKYAVTFSLLLDQNVTIESLEGKDLSVLSTSR